MTGTENLKGESKIREVKTRVNQNIFRQIVLANYSSKCSITGIDIPELLVASHIVPWAKHEKERLNPENGICLSALYDRAFDKGYIGISNNFRIIISNELKKKENKEFYNTHFGCLEDSILLLPKKYLPRKEFLQFHSVNILKK